MTTEADTCRKYVLPKLYAAGWTDDQICEQRSFTDGRIVTLGDRHYRKPNKKADYLLRYRPHFALAIVEAKAEHKKPGDGLQQAMGYAETLGLKFAYATNGHGIVEHDYTTGKQSMLTAFPSPEELWQRLRKAQGIIYLDFLAYSLAHGPFQQRISRSVQAGFNKRDLAGVKHPLPPLPEQRRIVGYLDGLAGQVGRWRGCSPKPPPSWMRCSPPSSTKPSKENCRYGQGI